MALEGALSHSSAPRSRRRLWIYRRHQEHYRVEDLIEHAEAALERAGFAPPKLDTPPAICLLDLAGYTRLTEEQSDEAAAGLEEVIFRSIGPSA